MSHEVTEDWTGGYPRIPQMADASGGSFAYNDDDGLLVGPCHAGWRLTIPPLVVVWLSDLLFAVPWTLILVIAHALVRLEERGLIDEFGTDYERYQKCVPELLPYRGAGGKRYRGEGA